MSKLVAAILPVGSLFAALLAGCDSDCANPSRVDQKYEVWHAVTNTATKTAEGDKTLAMTADYPSYELFVNGCTQWTMTYQSASNKLNVTILDIDEVQGTGDADAADAQSFEGTLVPHDANCNTFTVDLAGQ